MQVPTTLAIIVAIVLKKTNMEFQLIAGIIGDTAVGLEYLKIYYFTKIK